MYAADQKRLAEHAFTLAIDGGIFHSTVKNDP